MEKKKEEFQYFAKSLLIQAMKGMRGGHIFEFSIFIIDRCFDLYAEIVCVCVLACSYVHGCVLVIDLIEIGIAFWIQVDRLFGGLILCGTANKIENDEEILAMSAALLCQTLHSF